MKNFTITKCKFLRKIVLVVFLALLQTTFAQSWETVGSAGFSAGGIHYTSLAFNSSGDPYVAYKDDGNGGKSTVMKFNGTAWETVGSAGFSAGSATYTSLAFNSSGDPYVAYTDAGNSDKATVMKFNGTAWELVGTAGFSAGSATYVSLAFNSSGDPYVAYCDAGNSSKATVMKFNGTAWELVGVAGFSVGSIEYTSLAFNASDDPYVAYCDAGNSSKATVMKFNGTAWETVGSAGFSAGSAYYTSLAFNTSGEPYVAYRDPVNGNKATVMKFNGTAWELVGTAGFSDGRVNNVSLVLHTSGEPYVAFQDIPNSGKTTVMKFNGTAWVPVGTVGFSTGSVYYTSLAINTSGELYVAYRDGANSDKATVMWINPTLPPTVTTQAVSGIGSTTAVGNGNITDLGSPDPTQHGVCWNTSGTPTVSDNKTEEGAAASTGAFTSNITGLTPNKTYYARAYATNSEGTSYGAQVSFATSNTAPTLTSFSGVVGTTDEDTEVEITFEQLNSKSDASDEDGRIAGYKVTSVLSGTVKIGKSSGNSSSSASIIDASNKLYWRPEPNESGIKNAFSVKAIDDAGALSAVGVQVQISVVSQNDAPTAKDTTITISEDGSKKFVAADFGYSDVEGDPFSGIKITSGVTEGKLLFDGTEVKENQVIDDVTKLMFVPEADANGTPYTSFGFKVYDGKIYSDTENEITIDVLAENDSPVFISSCYFQSNEDDSIWISKSMWKNYIEDLDTKFSEIDFKYIAGKHTYFTYPVENYALLHPNKDWYGVDTITVLAIDGADTTKGKFQVVVSSVNDAPETDEIPVNIRIGSGDNFSFCIWECVKDAEENSEELVYSFTKTVEDLSLEYNSKTGDVVITAVNGWTGSTEILVKIVDKEGVESKATIQVEVGSMTSVNSEEIPEEYFIGQNYPNPFNPSTTIEFGLPEESDVVIDIYSITGELVERISEGTYSAGRHKREWKTNNLASGIYFYRIVAKSKLTNQSYVEVKKMVFIK